MLKFHFYPTLKTLVDLNCSIWKQVGADGWSRTQLRRQLLEAYIGLCSDGKIPQSLVIPAHPNYVDWTLWLERWLNDYGQEEK